VPAGVSDAELVARCCHGDGQAWRTLYDRHFSSVYRFVSALGVPIDEREDAVQEVFVSVYRSLPGFRGEAQLSTWIYRIAARHALRLSRRRRVRDVLGVLLARDVRPDPQPDPIERSSDLALLDSLLARLAPKKRTALVLFEIEGLSVDEIAQVVGCPVNTVWSRLHHARRELGHHARKLARTSGVGPGGTNATPAFDGDGGGRGVA
jgi:RNA polymerase sigma-70 factor (ECF subfamily)